MGEKMKQVTITPRIKIEYRNCRKCGKQLEIGDNVMVQRNQSGKYYCMECWNKICI